LLLTEPIKIILISKMYLKQVVNRNRLPTIIFISAAVIATGFITITNVSAQLGSMFSITPAQWPTYALSIIPGASQRESTYHYYPPAIAVPVGTTVGWFNNDAGQPHTVTSGLPGAPNAGSMFNSGIMPATAPGLYMYTFDRPGDFAYHCIIHPWRVAAVSVDGGLAGGDNFELSYGTGPIWNLSEDFRTLLIFKPTTVPLDSFTPVAYNITIYKNSTNVDNKVFSRTFATTGTELPLEFIKGSNETRSYGPDFSGTGAYHLEGAFFKDNADYTITAEISSINGRPLENQIMDEFSLQTVT
jgi:plastocyanin